MVSLATAFVEVRPDLRGFGTSLSRGVRTDSAKAGTEAGRSLSGKFAGALKIGSVLAAAFAVTKGITFFKGMIAEATEAQKVGAQTAAVIRSTGGVANVTRGQIERLSTAISNKVGVDDEAIQSGANLMLTFKNVRNEAGRGNDIFNQSVSVITDMSAALGQGMKTSSIQLGKALNDPIKGISSLTRVGVTFDAGQKAQIKTMVRHGNILGAQKVILRELNSEFRGSAAAQSTPAEKATVAWNNFKELLGTAVLPMVGRLADFFSQRIVPALTRFVTQVQSGTGAGGRLAAVFSGIVGVVGRVIATFRSGSSGVSAFGGQLVKTASAVGTFGRALLPTLLSIGRQLKAVVGPAIRDIGNLVTTQFLPSFRKMLPILLPVAKFLLQMFGSALVGAVKGAVLVIKGFINVISGVFKLVSAVIHGQWGKAWAALKQIVKGALQAVAGVVLVWWNVGILSIFRKGALRLLGSWRAIWSGLKGVATGGLRLAGGAVKAGLGLIGRLFVAGLRVLLTPWRLLFTGLKAAATVGWRLVRGAFTAAFSFLAGAIRGAVRVIAAPFRTLFTGLRTVAVTGWRLVKGAFTTAFSFLAGAIRGAVTRLVTPFRALFTAYKTAATTGWRIIKSAFTTALNAVKAVVSAVVSRVVAAWRTFFGALRSVAAAGWRIIKGAFTTAANAVRTVVSAVVNRLTGMWRTFFGALRSVAAAGWRIIKGAFSTAINAIRTTVSGIINRIAGAWRTFFGTLKTVAAGAFRILKGAFGTAFRAMRDIVTGIASKIATAWRTFFGTVKTITGNAFKILKGAFAAAFRIMKDTVTGIASKIATAWRTFFGTIRTITGNAFRILKGAFTTAFRAMQGAVKTAMGAISRIFSGVWTTIRGIGGKLVSLVKTTIPNAFSAGARAIGRFWGAIKAAAKAPVKFIVNTVWNNGLRKVINAIPGPLTAPYIGGFARGGVMPGYTPGRDVHRFVSPTGGTLDLSGGEAIMRPEFTRAVGSDLVHQWNKIARRGGVKAVREAMELGGDSRKKSGRGPHQRFAAGGLNVAGAVAFAKSQAGKPYSWGGVGPGGYDCSGFMSAITNVLRGRSPYSRVGATASFPWAGFVGGPGMFTIGSSPNYRGTGVGHMAGTLNGMNVESSGGVGVHYGPGARGYKDSGFTTHAHLGPGGNFGGAGGTGPMFSKWSFPNPLRFLKPLGSWLSKLNGMGAWGKMMKTTVKNAGGSVGSWAKSKLTSIFKAIKNLGGWLTGKLTGLKVIGSKLPFDRGGVATGSGVLLKRTIQPERMLDPRTTRNFERLTIALDRMDTDRSRGGGAGVQRFVLDIGGGRVLTGYIDDRIDTRKAAIDQRAAVRRKVVT